MNASHVPAIPAAGELLLVRTRVQDSPFASAIAERHLSEADCARLGRFVRPVDRARSMIATVLVRTIVGAWTNQPSNAVLIQRPPASKPTIAGGPSFNCSHAGDRVIVAFVLGGQVGVDVELVSDDMDFDELVGQCWHRDEMDEWRHTPVASRALQFFRRWVAKEATLKALGLGLDTMSAVALRNSSETMRITNLPNRNDPTDWTLRFLDDDPSYQLAVACDFPVKATRIVDV